MEITLIWLAVGLGCIWHGAQIVWVAPNPPSQFRKDIEALERGSPQAFQRFWLDQYVWLGIVLVVLGLVLAVLGVML
jgi:hypothetical protein